MKTSERLKTIGEVSSEMQRRYSFVEIDTYFKALGMKVPEAWDGPNSKRIYAAELLASLSDDRIFEICEDLELSVSTAISPVPKFWCDTSSLRLFISHISADKDKATRLRDCLLPYGISAFVAHEDIAPTLAWQAEIGKRRLIALVDLQNPFVREGVSRSQEMTDGWNSTKLRNFSQCRRRICWPY